MMALSKFLLIRSGFKNAKKWVTKMQKCLNWKLVAQCLLTKSDVVNFLTPIKMPVLKLLWNWHLISDPVCISNLQPKLWFVPTGFTNAVNAGTIWTLWPNKKVLNWKSLNGCTNNFKNRYKNALQMYIYASSASWS